jgi:hypothetical protein
LEKHIIIDLVTLKLYHIGRLLIPYRQYGVAESWNGKELLEHRIHVTNAAQVAETHKTRGAGIQFRLITCLLRLFDLIQQICEVLIDNEGDLMWVVVTKSLQETECGLSAIVAVTFVD